MQKTLGQKAKLLGYTGDTIKIFLVSHDAALSVINEIGRLRELCLRKTGEGGGDKRDLDHYDSYYKHLLLWDEKDLEIIAACRIGESENIIKKYSRHALYMSRLCHVEEAFLDVADQTIEIGRSFIQPKYWGRRALDDLWQGIDAYLKEYPHINYLYGAVSINDSLPQAAKDALVYFFKENFKEEKKFFKSFESYTLSPLQKAELKTTFSGSSYKDNLIILKEYLKNFDTTLARLFKHCSDLYELGGVSFSDFGIDEKSSGSIDAYLMIQINKMKPIVKLPILMKSAVI